MSTAKRVRRIVARTRLSLAAVLLAVALPACATLRDGAASQQAGGTVTVQLLAINDLHGHLEPPSGSIGRINAVEAGGVEYLATHLKNAVAAEPHSIIVGAGDLVGASPMTSSIFHDEPTIEVLNAIGLAVTAAGNHEFDEGYQELLRLQRGGCHPKDGCQDGDPFDGARFEYLSANVVRKDNGASLLPAATIRTVGGVKIGFIGATTRSTPQIVPASVGRDLTFLDEAVTANAQAAELKRQGVQAIVLLIHEGLRQSDGGAEPDPNGCAGPNGGLESIVSRLTDDIAVVISGHSHSFYNCRIGTHLVTGASSNGRMMTRVRMEVDGATGRLVRASAVNEIVTRDVSKDPATSRIVSKYAALVERTAGVVVGSVTGNLLVAWNRAGESALGSVVADAQLAATRAEDRGGAVVAFMNRGGLRADIMTSPPASVDRPGPVTYRELHNVQPFGNLLVTCTMTGDMIKRLLEQQFDNPRPGSAEMLQVSSGFTYQYRLAASPGARVDAESIRLDGRRIAPSDRIRVSVSDFLMGGGDAFTVFAESTDRVAVGADLEALVEYFKTRSPIASPVQNRIVRTD